MKIGFDLDEVFVSHPPFIPGWFIQKLYQEEYNGILYYRIPGKFEQKIRQLSHLPFFRLPIKRNVLFLKNLSRNKKYSLILISSRFGFLKNQTNHLLSSIGLRPLFQSMFFNYKNEQPHLFKSNIIEKQHIEKYIDDDLPLLLFLSKHNPQTVFFWINKKIQKKITTNLYAITSLQQFLTR